MVMASHVAGSAVALGAVVGGTRIPLGTAHAWGKVGVRVFFVISGFLITKLLLDERRRHESVSIKAFYLRRAFRILPAFAVYLGAVAALRAAGAADIPLNDLAHAITYTTNFDVERTWLVSHIWSLSVEEHYYLVWPVAFALLRPRQVFYVALATCFVSPIARWLVFAKLPAHLDSLVWQATPCVADSIATGCLLAFARDPEARKQAGPIAAFFERILSWSRRTPLTYLLLFPAFFTYLLETRPTIWTLVAVSFSNVCFVAVIDRASSNQEDAFGRVLTSQPVERIGVLSYSLYLWQQLFLRQSPVLEPAGWALLCAFPLNVVAALVCAHFSFELVERRVLKRRPRWADR
jgi:peptidoglycan/LPS O-acetylase OafA/YrhL